MNYQPGVDIFIIGYHQPLDNQEFFDYLMRTSDITPWEAWYVSVEATREDVKLGRQLWGDHHISVEYNCGHAMACNLVVPMSDRDTIFLCNADTRLPKGVIDRLYETLWSNSRYGVVGPRQIDQTGRLTAAGIFGTHARPQHRGWRENNRGYRDTRDDVIMASGALYMIKRKVWMELTECPSYREAEMAISGGVYGAMPAVKHYYSDTWPSYHMAAHGYRNVYEGRCTARHDWHKASPQGGWGELNLTADKAHFRRLCDEHKPAIAHD